MAYTKTNWQDLPNQTTPINATNLNKIENELETLDTKTTGVDYSSGTTNITGTLNVNNKKIYGMYLLYDGNSTGNITLSDSAANYDFLEIFYQGADNYNSVKIPNPNYRRTYLVCGWFSDNSHGNVKIANIYIQNTSISKVNYTSLNYSDTWANASEENGIQIIRVYGYK